MEQEIKMEIIKQKNQLPISIDKLHKFILIGKEKLKAHKAKIRAIEKIDESYVAKEAALSDAQDLAEVLIEAEKKLGEMLAGLSNPTSSQKGIRQLPEGITYKESHIAQTIAKNPEIVEKCKKEAREYGKILSPLDVYRQIKYEEREKSDLEKINIPLPTRKYKTLIIDPPWPIEKIEMNKRPIQTKNLDYPTMSIEQIKNFNIDAFYEKNVGCHIYLWTTDRFVKTGEAKEILEYWGASFRTHLIWHKNVGFTPFGIGWQIRHEFVLFGVINNLPLLKAGEPTVFTGKVREHSRKPDEFYELVKGVSPPPYIDIFSREKRDDFDQWGNETDKF